MDDAGPGTAAAPNQITVAANATGQVYLNGTAIDLSGYSDWYFRTAPPDTIQGSALGTLISSDGYQKIAFLVFNDTYGTGLRDSVQESVEASGGTVVYGASGEGQEFPPGQTTFSSEVTAALAPLRAREEGVRLGELIVLGAREKLRRLDATEPGVERARRRLAGRVLERKVGGLPALADEVRRVCSAVSRPVNVLAHQGLTMQEIVEAGGQRVSVGGGLTWVAVRAMAAAAEQIRDTGHFDALKGSGPIGDWLQPR